MKECKKIYGLLIDYAGGDISPHEQQAVEAHLETCALCREEFRFQQDINENMALLNRESDRVMQSIDWERNAREISRAIQSPPSRSSRGVTFSFSFNLSNWKALAPLTAAVLLLGIWLGYLFFHAAPGRDVPAGISAMEQQAVLERLEAALAKREVSGYFEQAHLVLTDLMRQCDYEDTPSDRYQWNKSQVKDLLNKSRYFSRDLDNPRLLSSKSLLKKIEWLLYEMLTMEDDLSCNQLQRLQDYVRREKLLLKIRLIGKEISI